MPNVCGSCGQPRAKKDKKAERIADRKALEGIIKQTVDFAMSLREHGGMISPPIELAMDAEGEALADRIGHGFDRDILDVWEAECRVAYRAALRGSVLRS